MIQSPRCLLLCCVLSFLGIADISAAAGEKPRLLVLTDMGADPDDEQSFIRLLVHANEFDIEGLIATSPSVNARKFRGPEPRADYILAIIRGYSLVVKNLQMHAEGFPSPEQLLELMKYGTSNRGRQHVGPKNRSLGSDWIISCVDREAPRPLNICIWGGQTDFAQALWQVREARGPEGLAAFTNRIRVFDISDQDRLFDWMIEEFPIQHYVLSQANPKYGPHGAYRGMYLGGDESLTSLEWLNEHVRVRHGRLGALYPPLTHTPPNPHLAMKEGDSPSFLAFLPFGLSNPDHPEWGGWGGRYRRDERGVFRNEADLVNGQYDVKASVWRWRKDIQNEFAARMEWCVKSYAEANHPPTAVLNGAPGVNAVHISTQPGETVTLSSSGSSDPDGDQLHSHWTVYPEAGTYPQSLSLDTDGDSATLRVPQDAAGHTIHVILSVRDAGSPQLTRHRRAVIAVQ